MEIHLRGPCGSADRKSEASAEHQHAGRERPASRNTCRKPERSLEYAGSAVGQPDDGNSSLNPAPVAPPDTSSIIGGNIIGIGSKVNKKSVIVYEKAGNYRLFEFIWDPSKDTMTIGGQPGSQIGTSNGMSQPAQGFGGQGMGGSSSFGSGQGFGGPPGASGPQPGGNSPMQTPNIPPTSTNPPPTNP